MTTTNPTTTPKTHQALVLHSPSEPLTLTTVPTPLPTPGTVIVRPLYTTVLQYAKDVFANGNPRGYKYALPLVPGGSGIARVSAPPPDATTALRRRGQLVFVEATVRARDDPDGTKVLQGVHEGFSAESAGLFGRAWRDGGWAEVSAAPLESVYALDEDVLVRRLGYRVEELGFLSQLLVPYGGLSDVGLGPGETVIVAPATGAFGGAAVHVALALGARVIAMGRNEGVLAELKGLGARREGKGEGIGEGEGEGEWESGRVQTVVISGDVQRDTEALARFGPADVFFDISPPGAGASSHIKAGIAALRHGGRVSLMGGAQGGVEFPYVQIMYKGLTLRGTYMNTPQQVRDLIRLVERGVLRIGERAGMRVTGKFGLGQWEEALERAAADGGAGRTVYFVPNGE